MRLRLAARKSDLARLQTYRVRDALLARFRTLEVEFQFRESLGDRNLNDPLWKMPEKGVFTEDFVEDLLQDRTDIVVHSWKDLPTVRDPRTVIAATLPRADQRDLLLVKKSALARIEARREIRVYSSSPRRAYNLEAFLKEYLPWELESAQFEPVRGNIQTRVRKLREAAEIDGLILAKAALDRMLEAPEADLQETREILKSSIRECQWMVLPLSINPNAAAQGALALEIKADRVDLREILARINCISTFAAVNREREILASYGGGCHQKIGVAALERPYGRVMVVRGLTDAGQLLNQRTLERPSHRGGPFAADQVFCSSDEPGIFEREKLPVEVPRQINSLFVAKTDAWSENIPYNLNSYNALWASGTATWKGLARKGVWVNGCQDGLGEQEPMGVESLISAPPVWGKLTHEAGAETPQMKKIPTYRLVRTGRFPDLRSFKAFFWSSGSQFLEAVRTYPEILRAHHSCGPGNSFEVIRAYLEANGAGGPARPEVYLDSKQWRQNAVGQL